MRRHELYSKVREQAANIRRLITGITRPIDMLDSTQRAGLVKVTLWFINHHPDEPARFDPTEHIVAEGEVDTLVTASLELYGDKHSAPVQYITTQSLRPRGPYWWSVPGLRRDGDPAGAVIWDWDNAQCVWVRPGVKIDEDYTEYAN